MQYFQVFCYEHVCNTTSMGGLIKDVAVVTWFALAAVAICGIIVTAVSVARPPSIRLS